MRTEKTVEQLFLGRKSTVVFQNGFNILKVPKGASFEYFAYDLEEEIGSGAFGWVYKGYSIANPNLVFNPIDLDKNKSYAVKKINIDHFSKEEAEICRQYYFSTDYTINGDNAYFVIPYFDGEDFSDFIENLEKSENEGDAPLSFLEIIEIIKKLSLNLVYFHDTKNGPPTVHCDIKEKNIRIKKYVDDQGNTRYLPYIIDFGVSLRLPNAEEVIKNLKLRGSPYRRGPEVLKGEYQKQSDIYPFLAILLRLLGVKKPLGLKQQKKEVIGRYVLPVDVVTPFDFTGLLDKFNNLGDFFELRIDLKEVITLFLKRMGLYNPSLRPSSEEVFHFFSILENVVSDRENNQIVDEKLCAEMLMLASGVANQREYQVFLEDPQKVQVLFQEGKLNCFTLDILLQPADLGSFDFKKMHRAIQFNGDKKFLELADKIEIELMRHAIQNPQDPWQVFNYSLVANAEVFESFLKNQSSQHGITFHKYLIINRDHIIAQHGLVKFSQLLDTISNILLKKVYTYEQQKMEIATRFGSDHCNHWLLRPFCHTVGRKLNGTALLADTMKTGSTASFFAPGWRAFQLRRAIKQGGLRQASAELVDYIQGDLRKISSIKTSKTR